MSKRKELSEDLKNVIVNMALRGYSLRRIGREVNKSHSTIQYIVDKFKNQGTVSNMPRKCKQRRLNEREERFLVRQIKRNPQLSVPKLRPIVEHTFHKKMCNSTVRRVLYKYGFHGRIPRKRPFVSRKNRILRLKFAKLHVNKPQEFWDKVIWSDETKINLFGSDGIHRVWRKPNMDNELTNTLPTVKHGGGHVMLWGCMSSQGVGTIHFIDGTMDKFVYNNILKQNVKQSAEKMGMMAGFMFQQDNDSKHTAEINKLWLIWNVAKQLRTPPQSADLNPIEHLWAILKRRIRKSQVKSKHDLRRVITEEWEKITPDICKRLICSMQRRCEAVIKAKGYSTKY